ncbi:MAG: (d)CMP kinase [Clostridia bacterium]|nr:(d)CMP kinase [Clostridia bacterium]
MNIAIDGPAGAGKSTVAKRIASTLGITYLDTGAMYRAVALYMLNNDISVLNADAVAKNMANVSIDIRYIDEVQHVFLNGEDVSTQIRQHHVSQAASDVSKHSVVREKMVQLQQSIASNINVIMDGRDIGSVVLPNAEHKFYLTASAEVRAQRRYDELVEKGQHVDYDELLEDIKKRDYNDTHRENSPLIVSQGAIVVDSSDMNVDEVVEFILTKINE